MFHVVQADLSLSVHAQAYLHLMSHYASDAICREVTDKTLKYDLSLTFKVITTWHQSHCYHPLAYQKF